MASQVYNPQIPYTGPLPQSLQPGYIIRVHGTVKPDASCFAINLQDGDITVPRNDIALHLSPVFTPPPRLVRNSIQNHQWGPEESHGSYFPFAAGQGFEIFILTEPEQFKIAVNGQHFTEFNHRMPIHMISHISIDGDVTVSLIQFDPPSGTYLSPQGAKSEVTMPIGFVAPVFDVNAPPEHSNPSQAPPYGAALPYPSGGAFPPQSGGYFPAPGHTGRTSPMPYPSSSPYGPPPGSPYGPPPGGYPAPPPPSPTAYPVQSHSYPGGYPSQPGPYPGTTVVYPGQESQKSSSSINFDALAAGAAAVAGAAGTALLGHKHKGGKHGHSYNPATALLGGAGHAGPAAMLATGVGSLLGPGKHGHNKPASSSSIPIGTALAGGAAALAGAYMLSKSPVGKVMKPKKMKKLYKHKHKLKHGFKGFGSSSSSSSSSEEE